MHFITSAYALLLSKHASAGNEEVYVYFTTFSHEKKTGIKLQVLQSNMQVFLLKCTCTNVSTVEIQTFFF